MAFFKTKPGLNDGEKARIEFHTQQISECLGANRLQLPVLGMSTLYDQTQMNQSLEQIVGYLGNHLGHNVDGLKVVTDPKEIAKCGSGG